MGARCGRAEAVRAVVVARAVMCRAGAVDERGHTRLQAGGDLVGLRLRQIARLDGSCQLGLLCRDERRDEAGGRLAARRLGDLSQGLPGLELSEERVLGDAQVRGCRGEPVAVAVPAVPVTRAAGAVTTEGAVDLGGLVRLQVGGELVCLRLRQVAGLDRGRELGLLGSDERVDQTRRRLAARSVGDLSERLPGLQRRFQCGLGDAEVRGRVGEVVVAEAGAAVVVGCPDFVLLEAAANVPAAAVCCEDFVPCSLFAATAAPAAVRPTTATAAMPVWIFLGGVMSRVSGRFLRGTLTTAKSVAAGEIPLRSGPTAGAGNADSGPRDRSSPHGDRGDMNES